MYFLKKALIKNLLEGNVVIGPDGGLWYPSGPEETYTLESLLTESHDSQHDNEALAWAAMYYAMPHGLNIYCGKEAVREIVSPMFFFEETGWDTEWAKRDSKDRIRQLTVAGALLAAEIDRLLAGRPE